MSDTDVSMSDGESSLSTEEGTVCLSVGKGMLGLTSVFFKRFEIYEK